MTTLTNAADLKPGQVVNTAGILRTIAKVTIEGEAVVLEWTPPQDPDTWEYLTDVDEDGERYQVQQPPTETTIHDHFEVE